MAAVTGKSPTAEIMAFAAKQPGGLIRWHEARDEYLETSRAARWAWRRFKSQGFHQNIKRIFSKYFVKVHGTNGFYVLKSFLTGED